MAAFSVAAFVLCFAIAGIAIAKADKKAYNKGYRALRKGDYTEAEKIFRDLLGKDGHDNDARLGLSFTLLKQRDLQGAYDNAARVIMADPLSARAHALLGSAILGAGEFRLSVEEFKTALALDENLHDAWFGIGLYHYYADVAPAAARMLRWLLALPGGDRVRGLNEMLRARRSGELLKDEADYQLHLIYLWYEKQPERALGLLEGLAQAHPRNPLFAAQAAGAAARLPAIQSSKQCNAGQSLRHPEARRVRLSRIALVRWHRSGRSRQPWSFGP